jgi:hypothetical protein
MAQMLVTTIRMPADLAAQLKAQADADDRSLSSLILHYARQGLARDLKFNPAIDPENRAHEDAPPSSTADHPTSA